MKRKSIVVVLCFLLVFLGLGFCSSSRSIYLAPMSDALGLSRAAFSISDTIRFTVAGVIYFFIGKLINRFGTKRLICTGLISLMMAVMLFANASYLILLYLAGACFGFGFALCTTGMVSTVINSYFPEKNGTLMGIVLGANGLGSAVSVQLYTPIIESDPFGYRTTFYITLALVCALLILFLIFYREPQQIVTKKKGSGREGLTLGQLKRMPVFYVTVGATLLTSAILQGVSDMATAYVRDVGIVAQAAAAMVSLHSIALMFTKILSGFVTDRFGIRASVSMSYIASTVAILLLFFLNTQRVFFIYGYAILLAVGLPMDTVMIPLITRHLFGQKDFASVSGVLLATNSIGCGIGLPLLNLSYDLLGTYRPILLVAAILPLALLLGYQWIIHKSTTIKKEQQL